MDKETKQTPITGLVSFVNELSVFVLKRKYWVVAAILTGFALGLTASFLFKPRYTGSLTFVLQGEDEMGGMSGLASQFGLSLGSASGTFSGDNIYELLTSRFLVEKALLAPVATEAGTNSLLNVFIKTYKLDKKWKDNEEQKVRDLSFPLGQPRESFTREQDSVMGIIYQKYIMKQLIAFKVDKKLSVGRVEIETKSELFSKFFVEKLMEETANYYVNAKTKISRTNCQILEQQADSIKREYDRVVSASASLSDQNLNVIRQSASVELVKKQTDMQLLASAYMEMKKNIELMKMTINKQTPLVEIIDRPIMPLDEFKIGHAMGAVLGCIFGGLGAFGFYFMLFMWKNRRRLL